METFKVKVIDKQNLTHNIVELGLELESQAKFDFIPGQFVQFIISEKVFRSYSIISLTKDLPQVRFCIKIEEGGIGSNFVNELKLGDIFEFRGPLGKFIVKDETKDVLFIATGVGVAPFVSMVKGLLEEDFKKKICLVFGVRNEQDIFYHDLFSSLSQKHDNFKFVPMLSQPQGGWQADSGRVTVFIEKSYQDYLEAEVFICGSIQVVKDVRAQLISLGFKSENLNLEIFT